MEPQTAPGSSSTNNGTETSNGAANNPTGSNSSSHSNNSTSSKGSSDRSLGSLLRLFKSSFFDVWMAVSYLYKYSHNGVWDYLCNELYRLPEAEVEFYLGQLCNLALFAPVESDSLVRFLLDKCAQSIPFALKLAWILHSYQEHENPQVRRKADKLLEQVEIAAVNRQRATRPISLPICFPSNASSVSSSSNSSSSSPTPGASSLSVSSSSSEEADAALEEESLRKRSRSDYFDLVQRFVNELGSISDRLRSVPVAQRQARLEEELEALARAFLPGHTATAPGSSAPPSGPYVPLWSTADPRGQHYILRVPVRECHVLNSRERVPYLVCFEVLEVPPALPFDASPRPQPCAAQMPAAGYGAAAGVVATEKLVESVASDEGVRRELDSLIRRVQELEASLQRQPGLEAPPSQQELQAIRAVEREADRRRTEPAPPAGGSGAGGASSAVGSVSAPHSPYLATADATASASSPFGETLEAKASRLRAQSPFGWQERWNLYSMIVKHGDELRQEQLAVQLVAVFLKIWQEARLPLYLRPYSILVTSAESGIIEAIPNVISLHQLHKFMLQHQNHPPTPPQSHPGAPSSSSSSSPPPRYTTLADYFRHTYPQDLPSGSTGGIDFRTAQRNFVESLAGYSLLCYFLQVKDRHNGNILLDIEGHIIHIDFGFMLSNSPGSLGFETAPFKLTQDFVDVMDGQQSPVFHYFKALCIRGFLELRKHHEKICLLVEMMSKGLRLPCFYGGQAALDTLRERFQMGLTEEGVIEHVEQLIYNSLNNWRTRHYDRYQYLTNNILY
jgi:phosphatidylinositol 4-kinase